MQRLKEVLLAPATGAAELMVAIYMMAFALPLFSIDRFAQSPTYAQMAKMAPGWVWGCGLCAIALWRCWAILAGRYHGRVMATAASIFSWCLLFLSFVLAQRWHPGVTVFASWSVMETWTLFRIRRRA